MSLQSISPFCKFPIRITTTEPCFWDFLDVPYDKESHNTESFFIFLLSYFMPCSLRHCSVNFPENASCNIFFLKISIFSIAPCSICFASLSLSNISSIRQTILFCSESGANGISVSSKSFLVICCNPAPPCTFEINVFNC